MAFLVDRLRPTAPAEPSPPPLRAGLLVGAAAAAAGVAAVALPLFFLWIVSPYVESGGGGVLHLAACLWLLAHGAGLRYGGTPLDVPPLLLTALAVALLYRAAAHTARDTDAAQTGPLLAGICAGYLLAGATAVAVADATGGLPGLRPAGAVGGLLLVALPTAAAGVRSGAGPVRPELPRIAAPVWALPLLRWARHLLLRLYVPGGAAAAVRTAAAAGATLLGGGALVFAVSLLLRFGAAGTISAQLAPDLVGRFALLLLCAVLLPNAAVWAAAYALGPGFALGGRFAPLTATTAQPPAFPLFAAVPTAGHAPWGLLALVVPVAAGTVAAVLLGRAAAEWGVLATVRAGVAAAMCTGVLTAVCAAASGGALGTAALARVGPAPWWTGLAALGWTLLIGVPGALLLRLRPGLGLPASGGREAEYAEYAEDAYDDYPDDDYADSGYADSGYADSGYADSGYAADDDPDGGCPAPGVGGFGRFSLRVSPARPAAWASRWWRRCCRRPG
ncbi:hypothetical protein GXW83_29650 [Streptacidiphilus sp. PB12-B1b]|uniref:cell division protein PerM n=1 Tax=Streptacidiphilus sp. PB12-B1b TaxID=2705012 RepID=UPI0015F8F563|nr:DUF6350 family protein [Streptacidiphilus sp. PB12-B1b]QMU79251.1 hypothetical protein GXW83_29650 [Streptacidiphilus sp. PB12-B1b]